MKSIDTEEIRLDKACERVIELRIGGMLMKTESIKLKPLYVFLQLQAKVVKSGVTDDSY